MSLQKEFEALGCWNAPTEEEHISVYGMNFDNCYIIFTDLDGKTPADAAAPLVAACYDGRDAFMSVSYTHLHYLVGVVGASKFIQRVRGRRA